MEPKPKREIVIATSNKHKVAEISAVLSDCNISLVQSDAPKLEVQASDICEVAGLAALQAYMIIHKPVIVEDAGLFIEYLRGFPGPYSSYVFETIGLKGILKLLEGTSNRRALFRSCIALATSKGVYYFRGEVRGNIAYEPRGSKGFGYDPIFIPEGVDRTFGEMSLEEKNMYSHRAKAARKLCSWLEKNTWVFHDHLKGD